MIERVMPALTTSVQVRPFSAGDAGAWEQFVLSHPEGTLFHRLAWSESVREAYGHRPLHLTAWRGDKLAGILPLFLVRSLFVGRVLVSVPYGTYGGILADSAPTAQALLEAAEETCRDEGGQYLELRHRERRPLDLPVLDRYETYRRPLPEDHDEILAKLAKRQRASCRQAIERLGDKSVAIAPHLLGRIHDLYVGTLRRLGSPPYRRRLFEAMLANYGGDCICAVVREMGEPIAGVVCFVFRDEFTPYFCGANQRAWELDANDVLYLRLMEYAARRGLKWFDYNRTRRDNPGPASFKRHMGATASPLHYQVFLNKAQAIPDLTPGNRRFELAQRVWRKLPMSAVRAIGGRVTKWIP